MELSTEFYDTQHNSFSATRFCLWDVVKNFGEHFKSSSYVLDAGCGNGKNMKYFIDKCNIVGIDKSSNLVQICKNNKFNVTVSHVENISYPNNTFDYIICIAVIHHIEQEEMRISAIRDMLRVLKPGGKILLTVWAFEPDEYSIKKKFSIGDNFIGFNQSQKSRYYYIYDKKGFAELCYKAYHNVDIFWERGNWNAIFTKGLYD